MVNVGHLQQLGVDGTPGLLPSHPGYLVEGNNSSKSQTPILPQSDNDQHSGPQTTMQADP